MFDFGALREQFPITRRRSRSVGFEGQEPLIYFDHAATTHPPREVLATYQRFLERSYANIHRGRYALSRAATEQFEQVREEIARFIGARGEASTVVLVGNTSQALDLAAHLMAGEPGKTAVSLMEHHSNDLPHRQRGPTARFGLLPDGTLDYEHLERTLRRQRVKLVAVTGASNVTGYRVDIHQVARIAHAHGARILVDAAQLLGHGPIDVKGEDDPAHLDFVAAAGHKAYAPFGSAFLYAPRRLADAAPPYLPGGGTVYWVTEARAQFKPAPERHEGGTPNIAGAIAFGAALRFLERIGIAAVRRHEQALTARAWAGLQTVEGLTLLGPQDPGARLGILSFVLDRIPHETVAARLDREAGIAVRNGCFCAHPYIQKLLGVKVTSAYRHRRESSEDGLPGAVRASFGLYNSEEEVERLLFEVGRLAASPRCVSPRRFLPGSAVRQPVVPPLQRRFSGG